MSTYGSYLPPDSHVSSFAQLFFHLPSKNFFGMVEENKAAGTVVLSGPASHVYDAVTASDRREVGKSYLDDSTDWFRFTFHTDGVGNGSINNILITNFGCKDTPHNPGHLFHPDANWPLLYHEYWMTKIRRLPSATNHQHDGIEQHWDEEEGSPWRRDQLDIPLKPLMGEEPQLDQFGQAVTKFCQACQYFPGLAKGHGHCHSCKNGSEWVCSERATPPIEPEKPPVIPVPRKRKILW
jgi:hypothetical protein